MKVGNYNRLSIGIYGTKSGLEWVGKDNDNLFYTPLGEPTRIITRGGPGALQVTNKATLMPPRHPEGYIEGFANQYSNAAELIWAGKDGRDPDPFATDLPTVEDGVRGLSFIEACVQSSTQRGVSGQGLGRGLNGGARDACVRPRPGGRGDGKRH